MDTGKTAKLKEKMELAFGKICKVGVMHGKLNAKEKKINLKEKYTIKIILHIISQICTYTIKQQLTFQFMNETNTSK